LMRTRVQIPHKRFLDPFGAKGGILMALRRCVRNKADHGIAKSLVDFQTAISCDQFIHRADGPHGQGFPAAAHVYLAHRKRAHFDAGSGSDDVGHNELTAIIAATCTESPIAVRRKRSR
jgi:hypothetical protein